MHFYHISGTECRNLSYSTVEVLMTNMIRIQHPETLPKPKKKPRNDTELLEYLKEKYRL